VADRCEAAANADVIGLHSPPLFTFVLPVLPQIKVTYWAAKTYLVSWVAGVGQVRQQPCTWHQV